MHKNFRQLAVVLPLTSFLVGCSGESAEQFLANAKKDLAGNERSAAVVQLKNALQKNPALGEARLLLGETLLSLGDARGAEIELRKARDAGQPSDKVVPALARALLAQNKFNQVLQEFGQVSLDPKGAMADLLASLATAFAANGRVESAMDSISASIAADPSNLRSQLVHVRLVAQQNGEEPALRALEAVVSQSPTSAEAWQLRGEILSAAGKSDAAIEAFRKSLQFDKSNIPARTGLISLLLDRKQLEEASNELAALRAAKASPGLVNMFAAMLALERDDLKTANESVQIALKFGPNDWRVLHLAGAIEFRRGSLLQAQKHLEQALQAAPSLANSRALLAQVLLRTGDSGKALTTLQPLLDADPPSVEALSIAAEAYFQEGDPKRAEEAIIKSARIKPDDPTAKTALALLQINKGNKDAGIEQLRSIAATEARPIADLALISTLARFKAWPQAIQAVGVLEKKLPNQPEPKLLRARIELSQGNEEQARKAFESALQTAPAYLPAALALAQLDMKAGNAKQAESHIKKIISLQPKNIGAHMALAGLHAQAGASKADRKRELSELISKMPTEVRPRIALVELQASDREFQAAVETAKAAVERLPDNPEALKSLANAYQLSGNDEEAIKALNRLGTVQPRSPEPAMLLAALYARRGDLSNATQQLKRALNIRPNLPAAQAALVSTEISRGNLQEARKLAGAIRERDNNNPLAYSLLGDIDAVQQNWAGAASHYRSAITLLPHPDIAIKLHRVLLAARRTIEAQKLEADWLAAHPDQLQFLVYLADAALVAGDQARARERYLAVLKVQPDNPMAANNLAWLLNQVKDPSALKYAELAVKLAPGQPTFIDTMAQVLATNGNLDRAISLQEEAVRLAPTAQQFRLHLAQLYVAAGKKEQARAELNRLTGGGDKPELTQEARRLLATL